jgi:hypothetical protein
VLVLAREQREKAPIDDRVRESVADAAERVHDGPTAQPVSRWFLIEGYRQGYVRIKVGGRGRSLEIKPRDYVTTLEWHNPGRHVGRRDSFIECPPSGLIKVKSDYSDEQQVMLVRDIKLIDDEQFVVPGISSVVRLYFFQRGEDVRAFDPWRDGDVPRVSFLVESRAVHGEIGAIDGALPVEQYELIGKVIERRPQVMYGVPEDGAHRFFKNGNVRDPVGDPCGMSVLLTNDALVCGVKKWVRDLFEVTNVKV